MFFLSLSIVLFDLDNFLFVPARLVVVHLIFSYWAAILRPPLSAIFLAPPNG